MTNHSQLNPLKQYESSSSIECSHPELNSLKPDDPPSKTNTFIDRFINVFNAVMERK